MGSDIRLGSQKRTADLCIVHVHTCTCIPCSSHVTLCTLYGHALLITRSQDSFIGPTASAIITCSCIFVLHCIEVPVLLINRTQVGSLCLIVLDHNLSLLDGLLCNNFINNYVTLGLSQLIVHSLSAARREPALAVHL